MNRQIERIPKNLIREPKGKTHEEKLQDEYDGLHEENEKLRGKLDELIVIKERMSNIIEICEINSHQNEKWLIVGALIMQGLNKLFKNFEKMTNFEHGKLRQTNNDNEEVENLTSQFIEEFRLLDINKREFASYVDSTIDNQKYMSSQIRNTDFLIQSKLKLEQKKYQEMVKRAQEDEQRDKIRQAKFHRQQELNEELANFQAKYSKFKAVFDVREDDDIDLESFEETPQFKNFLGNLDTKKTLEQVIFEKEIRIKDFKRQIRDMKTEKRVFLRFI